MPEREYYSEWDDPNYQQQTEDPNAQPLGESQTPSGGGPQGAESQPYAGGDETQAVNQALSSGGSSSSPVNPDGSISPTYGDLAGSGRGSTEGAAASTYPDYSQNTDPYPNTAGQPQQAAPETQGGDTTAQVQARWNSGSPPSVPLPVDAQGNTTHGWEWDGWDWRQVQGRGLGFGQQNVGAAITGGPGPGEGGGNPPPGPGGPPPPVNNGGVPPNMMSMMALMASLGGMGSGFKGFGLGPANKVPFAAQPMPQYQGPDQEPYDKAALDALLGGLNNSEWDSTRVAQMKEMQKEQALRMRKDMQTEVNNRFAGAGRQGAGAQEAILRRGDADTMSQILGSYRGVDQNAAQGRRNELLSTVGSINDYLSGQGGRSVSGYGAKLSGAQAGADQAYKAWQSQMQMEAAALQKAMAEETAKLDWRRTDFNGMMALAQLMEQQRQFNERMGYDWTFGNLDRIR